MKILVDGDSCPVKDIIVKVAKEFNIQVHLLIDSSHYYNDNYCKITIVGKGQDSVDFALINRTSCGDIIVTQDYGVATMALSKQAFPIHPKGLIYSDKNIDRLLLERHLSSKARRSGNRFSRTKKRTSSADFKFEHNLRGLIHDLQATEKLNQDEWFKKYTTNIMLSNKVFNLGQVYIFSIYIIRSKKASKGRF